MEMINIFAKKRTIDFRSFLKNDYNKEPVKLGFSFIPIPAFLDGGTTFFMGLGIAVIAIAIYEKHLISEGKEIEAEVMSTVMSVLFMAGGILGGLWAINELRGVFFI